MSPPIGSARAGVVSQVDAIPDSELLHSAYEARELPESDGETVAQLIDIEGDNNLADNGGGTLIKNGPNGNVSVDFARDNSYRTSNWSGTIDPPFAVFHVIQLDDTNDSVLSSGNVGSSGGDEAGLIEEINGTFSLYSDNALSGFSVNSDTLYIVSGIFDTSNSELRVDKNQEATGDTGNHSITDGKSFAIGNRPPNYDRAMNGKWMATYVYYKLPDVSKVETYLDDEFGPV